MMTRSILIRHLAGSSLAGRSREFRQPRVRVGRRAANDVVFDPDLDRTVSGFHCEIVADADADELFVIDAGSTNGTFVNGLRVAGRAAVTARDQVMLGDGGPVLAVSLAGAGTDGAPAPATIVGRVRGPGADAPVGIPIGLLDGGPDGPWPADAPLPPLGMPVPTDAPALADALAPHLSASATSTSATAVAPVAARTNVPFAIAPHTSLTRPPPSGDPSPAALGAKTSIGMGTLMVELDKATRRERKRVFALAVPVVAVLLLGSMGLTFHATRPAAPAAAAPPSPPSLAPSIPPPAGPPDWATVLGPRKAAVYLVVKQRPGKTDRGLGTAWSAARGLLATNAHVAEAFDELEPGEALIARSNTSPPADLRIAGVALHPGYVEFERLRKAHHPLDAETGKPLGYPAPYDAALLAVAEADVPAQQPPLTVADAAGLARIPETAELAYVGFPMEASVERGVNVRAPVAHQFVGYLSRKTDIFLSATTEDRANFWQYTLVVQGGASGSPVFARDGRVVGLIGGNDHVFNGAGGRVAIAGKSFGPRADAVRDLLDGSAAARVAPHAAEWRAHFRDLFDRGRAAGRYDDVGVARSFASFEALAAARSTAGAARSAGAAGPPFDPRQAQHVGRWVLSVDGSGPGHARATTAPPLDEAGVYCVVVSTDDPDLLPRVTLPEVTGPAAEQAFGRLSPRAAAALRGKLGDGSPCVASYPVVKRAGEALQFVVAGVGAGPEGTPARATMTATLVRALE